MTYYEEKPTSPTRPRELTATLRGQRLFFKTQGNVFSPKRVDPGTRLLINECRMKPSWKVLDMGCGYGAVGIAINKAFPHTSVVMVDINERAVQLAKINIKKNAVTASVKKQDGYEGVGMFDTVLLNPPQTAGKKVCNRLIKQAKQHILNGGCLQLVARHQKGGKSYATMMQEVFGNVQTLGRQSGYRIYISMMRT